MKPVRSHLHRNKPTHSPPASAERRNEATKRVVIDDDRMFREREVQVGCDLGRVAKSGKLSNPDNQREITVQTSPVSPMPSDPSHARPTSAFPSPATISDPSWTLIRAVT